MPTFLTDFSFFNMKKPRLLDAVVCMSGARMGAPDVGEDHIMKSK